MANKKNHFTEGPIMAQFIADSIVKHQTKTHIGAHDIFLGQVRNDVIEGNEVRAIEYTAYTDMANDKISELREEAITKFNLSCLHVHHSLGAVEVGGICLFVFASAAHRKEVFQGLQWIVERIKKEVPVFGKELFEGDAYQWKVNT